MGLRDNIKIRKKTHIRTNLFSIRKKTSDIKKLFKRKSEKKNTSDHQSFQPNILFFLLKKKWHTSTVRRLQTVK